MSKIALNSNASGTGVFTIASPNSDTDRTLTLPDEAGTIITTAGVPSASLPSGSVLQVVSGITATTVAVSSQTLIDTGLSASITPSSADSQILVLVSQTISPVSASTNTFGYIKLLRNSTSLVYDQRICNVTQYNHNTWSAVYLDSPATTSAVTYKTQIASASSSVLEAQHNGTRPSTIALLEIAG